MIIVYIIHNTILFSLNHVNIISPNVYIHLYMSNTVIVTCGEESVYHSEEPETPQVVGGVNVAQSLYF